MTIDERLQVLLQSTESLHASVQELTESVAHIAACARVTNQQLEIIGRQSEANGIQIDIASRQISLLAEAMTVLVGIVEAHEKKLNG